MAMKTRAQSTIEYVVLFSIITAALLGMTIYIKRAMQGRMRVYAEQIGDRNLYSPGATNSVSQVLTTIQETARSEPTFKENESKRTSDTTVTQDTPLRTEELLPLADEPRR